jgi:hypothetical protein
MCLAQLLPGSCAAQSRTLTAAASVMGCALGYSRVSTTVERGTR